MSEKEERITNVSRQKSVAAASDVKTWNFQLEATVTTSIPIYISAFRLTVLSNDH